MVRNGWLMMATLLCALSLRAAIPGQTATGFDREFQSALSDYNAGNFARAAQELEALARQAPEHFEIEELLGLSYSAQGKEAEARAHLENAVRLKPNSASARCNLAVILAKLGER